MNPNCGKTDKIVITNDNIQNLIYLSAIVCLSVGRILLKKNSPIYVSEMDFFINFKILIKNTFSQGSTLVHGL